jgi:hypothetical protein
VPDETPGPGHYDKSPAHPADDRLRSAWAPTWRLERFVGPSVKADPVLPGSAAPAQSRKRSPVRSGGELVQRRAQRYAAYLTPEQSRILSLWG